MRGNSLVLAACVAVALATVVSTLLPARPAAAEAPAADARIARGGYLVALGGCNDCHTPFKPGPNGPEPDMSRMLSGHPAELEMPPPPPPSGPWIWSGAATNTAFAGPWGVSFARNLTPDAKTGLGSWTLERFARAIREGKHLGLADQRPVLPPMPWQGLARLTDEDVEAIWLYLQSIPAIENDAQPSAPAPPPSTPAP